MATVITNLLSAIPVFGHDLVESNHNLMLENKTILGIEDYIITNTIINVLPTVGTVRKEALKKGKILRSNKNEYLTIPYQFISFLVGLIDGDGYIQITKTTKGYIAIKLVIDLTLKDLSTLDYLQSVLKIGKLTINRDIKNPNCKLIISKTDLQEVIFPLLIHHNIYFFLLLIEENNLN